MADGWCLRFSLLFNISETKHISKSITTVITVTSKVLLDKPIRKYIAISHRKLAVDFATENKTDLQFENNVKTKLICNFPKKTKYVFFPTAAQIPPISEKQHLRQCSSFTDTGVQTFILHEFFFTSK